MTKDHHPTDREQRHVADHPEDESATSGASNELADDAVSEEQLVTEALAEELASTRQELESARDKWIRAVADLDNYKKRVRRESDDAIHRAVQDLLGSFLSTVDNLDRALELAGSDDSLGKGLRMVQDEFIGALSRHGVVPVDSVGQPFDPMVHEAISQIDSPDHAPGTIIREYERGYKRGDKLLRPARVVVAGPGSMGDGGTQGDATA